MISMNLKLEMNRFNTYILHSRFIFDKNIENNTGLWKKCSSAEKVKRNKLLQQFSNKAD